jgi:hypothetical protein
MERTKEAKLPAGHGCSNQFSDILRRDLKLTSELSQSFSPVLKAAIVARKNAPHPVANILLSVLPPI